MGNPSVIWAQLALPYSSAGLIIFVDIDGATVVIDPTGFYYTSTTSANLGTGSYCPQQATILGGLRLGYSDSSGVPGNATINKPAGRCAFAAGTANMSVTNSFCKTTSIVQLQLEGAFDATLTRLTVAVGNGIFVITGNAAATGITKFNFKITNVV